MLGHLFKVPMYQTFERCGTIKLLSLENGSDSNMELRDGRPSLRSL